MFYMLANCSFVLPLSFILCSVFIKVVTLCGFPQVGSQLTHTQTDALPFLLTFLLTDPLHTFPSPLPPYSSSPSRLTLPPTFSFLLTLLSPRRLLPPSPTSLPPSPSYLPHPHPTPHRLRASRQGINHSYSETRRNNPPFHLHCEHHIAWSPGAVRTNSPRIVYAVLGLVSCPLRVS